MFLTFSQKWAKKKYETKIRELINTVKTKPTKNLWIKIFFYKNIKAGDKIIYITKCNGHYRSASWNGHGFYDSEWKFIHKHPEIKHCITLKLSESATELRIGSLIAHEYRHYLQYDKYGTEGMHRKVNGRVKAPVQVESDTKKWAKKRIETLTSKDKLCDIPLSSPDPELCFHQSRRVENGFQVCAICGNKEPTKDAKVLCCRCKKQLSTVKVGLNESEIWYVSNCDDPNCKPN